MKKINVTKFLILVVVFLTTVALVWKINEPLVITMRAEMTALQTKAERQQKAMGVRLANWLSQQRWLGPLKPLPINPHRVACPAPSTALLCMPLVGRSLMIRRFRDYRSCMEQLLYKGWLAIWFLLLVAIMLCLPVLVLVLLRYHVRRRNEQYVPAKPSWLQELENMHKDFLQCHIPFLTRQQTQALESVRELGSGANGCVRLVVYEGALAATKVLMPPATEYSLLTEASRLVELDGAGGMPRALALCLDPPTIVLEFVGETYDIYWERCSVRGFLDSLVSIAGRLKELHAAGVVHNDLKANNITFSGGHDNPLFHIIDCGLTCRAGQIAPCGREDEDEETYRMYPWVAPEVLYRRPVFPSGDVYSLGALIKCVLQVSENEFLSAHLRLLHTSCMQREPWCRPTLDKVVEAVTLIKEDLPCCLADEKLVVCSPTPRDSASLLQSYLKI